MTMWLRWWLIFCLCLSGPVMAQTETAEPAASQPESISQALITPPGPVPSSSTAMPSAVSRSSVTNPLIVLGGLGLIVGLIYACAWLMKRVGAGQFGAAGEMKIIAGVAVGPREKVLLIEVGQQQVLVGVAPGRVSHLQSFNDPVILQHKADSGQFAERFKSMLSTGKEQA